MNSPVRILALAGSVEFGRVIDGLRAWGYAVTAARDPSDVADPQARAFDLACIELGRHDAPPPLEALRLTFPGLPVLAATALSDDALDRLLKALRTSRQDFAEILPSPLDLGRLVFAVEEALARRDAPERVSTLHQRRQAACARRRPLENSRLSDFLSRNVQRHFFFDFQDGRLHKEKR
jgi:hypothetical protein